ncbi:MAG: type II secretion system protein GspE [Deltaproteobacteria bacterium]|nr:MAG: type II secretion system protein GspE [Deltaproteobacteria bacterium]
MKTNKRFIGEILLEKGKITERDLNLALAEQNITKEKIGEYFVHRGIISYDDLYQAISEQLEIPLVPISEFPKTPLFIDGLTVDFIKKGFVIPANTNGNVLTLLVADPLDFPTFEAIKIATGMELELRLARKDHIEEAMEKLYGTGGGSMDQIIEEIGGNENGIENEEDIAHLKDMASEAPVIRLVNLIITRAIESRSSDIHLEPFENEFKVRYRIDGVLHDVESPPRRLQSAIISRIKIMAKMNIAERRLPQDGRIKMRILGREIDFRVSTIPTLHGESVVLRILDKSSIILDLKKLGMDKDLLYSFTKIIQRPHGIILVTGPTGSGKTTTLYSVLEKINSPEKKIITVEDPVEYQLKGVNQIQVKPSIGLTFANGLRSIVRQDPDIILIGEIRDAETAEIAIQSALTGHLVFSTLHTNDAAGAITRLLDMGMEEYLLASTIIGVLAQRLVRVCCPKCEYLVTPEESILKEMEVKENISSNLKIKEVKGCDECSFTGYKGRTGIFEYLEITDPIRSLILMRKDANTIKDEARRLGMKTLREDGWNKVKKGITTVAEVLRVTQQE